MAFCSRKALVLYKSEFCGDSKPHGRGRKSRTKITANGYVQKNNEFRKE